jgi:hypothetical protein
LKGYWIWTAGPAELSPLFLDVHPCSYGDTLCPSVRDRRAIVHKRYPFTCCPFKRYPFTIRLKDRVDGDVPPVRVKLD